MADVIYNAFKKNIANGSIDLDTDTIKVILVTAPYQPDQDAHSKRLNITSEVSGTGYAAGGALHGNTDARLDRWIEGVAVAALEFRTSHHV